MGLRYITQAEHACVEWTMCARTLTAGGGYIICCRPQQKAYCFSNRESSGLGAHPWGREWSGGDLPRPPLDHGTPKVLLILISQGPVAAPGVHPPCPGHNESPRAPVSA